MSLMVAALASSCASNDDLAEEDAKNGGLVLRLRLDNTKTMRGIKGNPSGGEGGDGWRQGEHHENDIESLTLFYYNHSDGINAPEGTPVTKITHINNVGFHPTADNTTAEIELSPLLYHHQAHDQFLVCVNTEDINAATLGDLRDMITDYAWKPSLDGVKANFTNFVMSNERNSSFYQRQGTREDPDVIDISVERIMARLDFCVDGSVVDGTTLRYVASDGMANRKVGDVYLSHVRAFNVMQPAQIPYLIKRLADVNDPLSVSYLDDEWDPATRLVVEPRTWDKNTPDIESWYRGTAFHYATDLGDGWFRDADRVHVSDEGNGFTNGISTDAHDAHDIQHYYVLDYANENTMAPAYTTNATTTGMLLKAVYMPVKVYKQGLDPKEPEEDTDYVKGQTFWRYRPISQQYDETKAFCFSSKEAAEAYMNATPEVAAEITKYEDGKCYYPVFLRHDHFYEDPDINLMEYGIVRNNIYRLKVEFSGPGYPKLEDIEVNPDGIRPYIFVRRWYKIYHPEIEI